MLVDDDWKKDIYNFQLLATITILLFPALLSIIPALFAHLVKNLSGLGWGQLLLYMLLWAIISAIFAIPVVDAGNHTMLIPYTCAAIVYLVSLGYPYVVTTPDPWWLVVLRLAGTTSAGWVVAIGVYVAWQRLGPSTVGRRNDDHNA